MSKGDPTRKDCDNATDDTWYYMIKYLMVWLKKSEKGCVKLYLTRLHIMYSSMIAATRETSKKKFVFPKIL
jgi:hypothetical protein